MKLVGFRFFNSVMDLLFAGHTVASANISGLPVNLFTPENQMFLRSSRLAPKEGLFGCTAQVKGWPNWVGDRSLERPMTKVHPPDFHRFELIFCGRNLRFSNSYRRQLGPFRLFKSL